MSAATLILLTAGFTSYLLISPAVGIALWSAALIVQVVNIVLWAKGKRELGHYNRES